MTVTLNSFKTVYPAFDCEDDDRIQVFIDKATRLAGKATKWGSLHDDAIEALTAHQLARTNEATNSEGGKGKGQLVSLSVENQYREQYAQAQQQSSQGSSADSEYQTTIYGQQYLLLKKRVIGSCVIGIV